MVWISTVFNGIEHTEEIGPPCLFCQHLPHPFFRQLIIDKLGEVVADMFGLCRDMDDAFDAVAFLFTHRAG